MAFTISCVAISHDPDNSIPALSLLVARFVLVLPLSEVHFFPALSVKVTRETLLFPTEYEV